MLLAAAIEVDITGAINREIFKSGGIVSAIFFLVFIIVVCGKKNDRVRLTVGTIHNSFGPIHGHKVMMSEKAWSLPSTST